MKKSQLYGQVFTYILTVMLISVILVYGYNSIQNFRSRAEQVSCLKLENDLKNAVETVMGDFGSVKKKELQVCSGYTKVCFVESFSVYIRPTGDIDPIIEDNIQSNLKQNMNNIYTGKNIFLVDNLAKESFYVGSIEVYPDVLCLSAKNGKVTLKLEGKGDYVSLEEWA